MLLLFVGFAAPIAPLAPSSPLARGGAAYGAMCGLRRLASSGATATYLDGGLTYTALQRADVGLTERAAGAVLARPTLACPTAPSLTLAAAASSNAIFTAKRATFPSLRAMIWACPAGYFSPPVGSGGTPCGQHPHLVLHTAHQKRSHAG